MDLIKSRSEVKVLLEEISHHKTQKQSGANSEEKFPNLLLSSLDKLFEDKQQQLWLVKMFFIHGFLEAKVLCCNLTNAFHDSPPGEAHFYVI